jgi:hypothetical protein
VNHVAGVSAVVCVTVYSVLATVVLYVVVHVSVKYFSIAVLSSLLAFLNIFRRATQVVGAFVVISVSIAFFALAVATDCFKVSWLTVHHEAPTTAFIRSVSFCCSVAAIFNPAIVAAITSVLPVINGAVSFTQSALIHSCMLAVVAPNFIILPAVSAVNTVGGVFSLKSSSIFSFCDATLSLMYSSGRSLSTFHALPTPTFHHHGNDMIGIVENTFCPKS